MRRTSPPRTSSAGLEPPWHAWRAGPSAGGRSFRPVRAGGFTLVEILVALVVAVLLCGAIAAGLMLVLREEARSTDAQEMSLSIRSVSSVRILDPGAGAAPLLGGLTAECAQVEYGAGDAKDAWTQWSIYRSDRPSQRVRLLFPTNGVPIRK
jgi:type II secretory pathway pseudopilin PulG